MDHVGFTVPDIEQATRFFVDVLGCEEVFEVGPMAGENDWMKEHLNVHPRAIITKLRMLKCATGPAFELFEYSSPDQDARIPSNSDLGGFHLALYVEDMAAAISYLTGQGVVFQGEPTVMTSGPSAGLTWVYCLTPWGMQLELVYHPQPMACETKSGTRMWRPGA
jgi:catechol 2,3-dioxygenase-like lactoylglutathione lyase family enzyme